MYALVERERERKAKIYIYFLMFMNLDKCINNINSEQMYEISKTRESESGCVDVAAKESEN